MSRNSKGQHRNKHGDFKIKVRRMIPCGATDDVFDLFAGDGLLFRRCWESAGKGATCDIDDGCVISAARERHGWTVLKVDVEKALRGGIWCRRPFSVIDIDCFGSPWRFFRALFSQARELANPCRIVMTDHYMIKRNFAVEDKSLGFRKPGSPEDYLACVGRLLRKTVVAQGWSYDRKLYREGVCVQHLLTLTRALGWGNGVQ